MKKEGCEVHRICLEDGDEIMTTSGHVQLLDQPDLTNIPTDVGSYENEIRYGLTADDIAEIARPQSFSPLQ